MSFGKIGYVLCYYFFCFHKKCEVKSYCFLSVVCELETPGELPLILNSTRTFIQIQISKLVFILNKNKQFSVTKFKSSLYNFVSLCTNFVRLQYFTAQLQKICQEYYDRMYTCEGHKWDLEYEVRKKDWEVQLSNKIDIHSKKSYYQLLTFFYDFYFHLIYIHMLKFISFYILF